MEVYFWLALTAVIIIYITVVLYRMKKDGNFDSLEWYSYHEKETHKKSGRN